MSWYARDQDLLDRLSPYVREVHGGVVSRAASALRLDYNMLRRFLHSGRAKPENTRHIRDALDEAGWVTTINHNSSQEMPIGATRSMLTQLLNALDAYQRTSDGERS